MDRGDSNSSAEERAVKEFERDLKRNEKIRTEEGRLLEDRVNNSPNFKKPFEGTLDYLKMLVYHRHAVEEETCFTCVPPPTKSNTTLRVGNRVYWLGGVSVEFSSLLFDASLVCCLLAVYHVVHVLCAITVICCFSYLCPTNILGYSTPRRITDRTTTNAAAWGGA